LQPTQPTPSDPESLELSYNPLQADAYAEHLAEVNESKEVVASTDIHNSQGLLLVRKGQPLSNRAVERIVQFKLAQPLEACVSIADSLTAEKLRVLFEESLRNDEGKVLYAPQESEEITEFCKAFFYYPLLVQKLTVLSLQMPQDFHKSIFVARTSLSAALRMQMKKEERLQLFIAALVHDIGMLHIPREVTATAATLTQEQWRSIKCHPIIGQKILEQIKNLSPAIARAVLEHHEMADGTGYPAGKFGKELSLSGQLINLLDTAFAIMANKLAPRNLGASFIAPILQINSSSYRPDIFSVVVGGLHELKQETLPAVPLEQCRAVIDNLTAEADMLEGYRASVFEIANTIVNATNKKSRHMYAALTLSQQLEMIVRSSGILDNRYLISFLQEIEKSAHIESDVEEAYLMLQELRWQFSKLTRICLWITESENVLSAEQRKMFSQALNSLPPLS
jgi:HD-GYP domain-containing protein (c-di-GMP phosphodiesterase class II)